MIHLNSISLFLGNISILSGEFSSFDSSLTGYSKGFGEFNGCYDYSKGF